MNEDTLNPFGALAQAETSNVALGREQQRSAAEVAAAIAIAKAHPRDQRLAVDRILKACTRATLAEEAIYTFPRGTSKIEGPSIRLAEAMAQAWGNIQFGIRELSQAQGVSTVEAYAWDVETNTRQSREFHVRHERKARGAIVVLEDPRDVYEMVANQGAHRLRACILGVIPGDVVDAAVRQCRLTQEQSVGAPEEAIKQLVAAFAQYGVDKGAIAKRLGHKLSATTAAEVVDLRRVFASIRDAMGKPSDFFEIEPGDEAQVDELNEAIAKRKADHDRGLGSDVEPGPKQSVPTVTECTHPEWDEVTTDADKAEGLRTYACTACGIARQEEHFGEPCPHESWTETTDENGVIGRRCDECGEHLPVDELDEVETGGEPEEEQPVDEAGIIKRFESAGDADAWNEAADLLRSMGWRKSTKRYLRCDEAMVKAAQRLGIET